jgi:putative ABC transport system permease protein
LAAQTYTIVDWRVLGFAIAIAAVTGLVFGVLPASLIGRMHSRPGPGGAGVHRMRGALVAMQAAFTVVLVAGSMTMTRSFLRLMRTDLGMHTDHVITLSTSLLGSRPDSEQRKGQYYQEVLRRLRSLPGVESAAAVEYLPLQEHVYGIWSFRLQNGGDLRGAPIGATPDYFRTSGIRLLAGRDFTDADRFSSQPVAIVNQEFARQTGRLASLVGERIVPSYGKVPLIIAGVVETARIAGSESRFGSQPQVFLPVSQRVPLFLTFVAKVRGNPAPYLLLARDVVRSVAPTVAVYDVKTLDQWFQDALARPRFYTGAVLFFGIFAMLLAVIGVHGVASYSIAQRAHEIGVRLAIGAPPDRLRATLLRQSLPPVAAGAAAGIAGAVALGRFLQHLMQSAEPVGAGTCALAALLLGITAALAVWTATRRVVKMDPMRVLRAE